jgi:hypothetical protein
VDVGACDLPTLKVMAGLLRGVSMASRQRAEELIEESQALRAEADLTLEHSRALVSVIAPLEPSRGGYSGHRPSRLRRRRVPHELR